MHQTTAITWFLLNLLILSQYHTESTNWDDWKLRYGKRYTTEDDRKHHKIWEHNRKLVEVHNKRYQQGLESYELVSNKYGDMDPNEFGRTVDSSTDGLKMETPWNLTFKPGTDTEHIPDQWDWRDYGLVTEVKDQGTCVGGNSFAAVGALEGQMAKKGMKNISLSAQQIIDCSGLGCNGAGLNETYEYLVNYGIQTDQTYPWKGQVDKCKYKKENVVLNVTGFAQVEPGNELELKSRVYHYGPISATMRFPIQMAFYKNGILDLKECVGYFGEQPLLIVGYGIENGTDYWLLKGSYGTDWGINGYAKLRRNRNNMCLIASKAYYPIV